MEEYKQKFDVGIIVGRFQVHKLHDSHIDLILSVQERCARTIVVLGINACAATINNPLDFEARKQMLLTAFPDLTVLCIRDCQDDLTWSIVLDLVIDDVVSPTATVGLFGGRDSFVTHYMGRHPTVELCGSTDESGSAVRDTVRKIAINNEAFRAGAVWSQYNRYPTPVLAVDCAIIKGDEDVILGQKPNEDKWRFIGGFVNIGETLEQAAKREVSEETNIEVSGLTYLDSFIIDDWRYRKEREKIVTAFFVADYTFGTFKAKDDISKLSRFKLKDLRNEMVVDCHIPLLNRLKLYKGV